MIIPEIISQTKAACTLLDSMQEVLSGTDKLSTDENETALELFYQAYDLIGAAIDGINRTRDDFEFTALNSEIDDYGRIIVRRILRKYAAEQI